MSSVSSSAYPHVLPRQYLILSQGVSCLCISAAPARQETPLMAPVWGTSWLIIVLADGSAQAIDQGLDLVFPHAIRRDVELGTWDRHRADEYARLSALERPRDSSSGGRVSETKSDVRPGTERCNSSG